MVQVVKVLKITPSFVTDAYFDGKCTNKSSLVRYWHIRKKDYYKLKMKGAPTGFKNNDHQIDEPGRISDDAFVLVNSNRAP